jgi:galactokinase
MKRKPVNESARTKSKASKAVASTKGRIPIIGEHVDFKARMKKLANII